MRAIGIDPQMALQRLTSPEAKEQALDAWKMLNQLAANNDRLNEYLDQHKQDQLARLGEAYFDLLGEANNDRNKKEVLERADEAIERDLPALMLFPENGLLDHLIGSIEHAAQFDNGLLPGEQRVLDELRRIRTALVEADLADPQTWRWVGDALQRLSAEHRANIARFTPGGDKRMIN